MSDLISRQEALNAVSWDTEAYMAINMLPSAQKRGEWIPCSERLPEKNSEYLVTKVDHITDDSLLDIAVYCDWIQNNNGFYKADEVIAWMPLPKPYSGADMREVKE